MSTPAKSANAASTPAEVNVTPGFEDKLNQFWGRNRRGLVILGTVILLAILARGGWDYLAAQKDLDTRQAYAAATTTDQLRAFAQAKAGHELAGVAWLQVADAAYAEGKSNDAITAYQASAKVLTSGPLASRAALGLAMAQLQAGQAEVGKTALQALVDVTTAPKALRAEAAYLLASLAHTAGDEAKFQQLAQQIMQIDPTSPWTQRLMMLQIAKPAAAVTTPAPTGTPAATPAEAPAIKLNLGK